ncbi:MAG: serine/threonine-protein kinase, partial [Candidatus Micrarchaeota archaeon]
SGGMGKVYLAEHIDTGTAVIVKMSSGDDPKSDLHIEDEYNALLYFDSPHVVRVFDGGMVRGRMFLVLEYLEGMDLGDQIGKFGPLPQDAAAEVAIQALIGLEAVHGADLLHCDVKPSNLFLAETPAATMVKLVDFGLASTKDGASSNSRCFGTPLYMPPEMVSGVPFDHRADLYALGVSLYYMLSGREPFEGNAAEVMTKTISDRPPPLSSLVPGIHPGLENIVSRAMEKDPEKRFRSAIAFREALEFTLEGLDQTR